MNDTISLLEQQLEDINNKLNGFERQRIYNDKVCLLFEQKRSVQRQLSLEKGLETAILIDYPYP